MELGFSKNLNDISGEFADVKLGDYRLERRLELITNRMLEHSARSFPDLFPTAAELEGAYRFFLNERVHWKDLLAGHKTQTANRCSMFENVVVAHDTTTFSFLRENAQREGMGSLSSGSVHTQGFLGHFSLCVGLSNSGPERVPLGVIEVNQFTRTGEKKALRNRKIPLNAENESYRWFSQIQQVEQSCQLPGKLIHVTDREAESYELFNDCIKNKYRFVFRLAESRTLADGGLNLFERLQGLAPLFETQVQLSHRKCERSSKNQKRHPPREKRLVTMGVVAQQLIVKKSRSLGNFVPPTLTLNFVRIWETDPPAGEVPVEWILATTEPTETVEQINRVVDAYRARWVIEEYFKALKTGCSVEERQHEKLTTILNILAVCIPVACHLLTLRTMATQSPSISSKPFISSIQRELLKAKFPERTEQLATVQGVLTTIAKLGGYLQYSGPPGWLVLSRGYRKLLTMELGVQLYTSRLSAICDER